MTTPSRPDPLPRVLIVLTVTTGLVDAVSVLGLGRVFTANMPGNVVFLGFAMAGVVRRWLLTVAGVDAGGSAVGAGLVSLGGLAPPLVVTGACILLVAVAYAAHPASKAVSSSDVHQ